MHIDRGPNFQVFLTNMLVSRGASNFKIEKLKVNLNEPTFDFIIHLPKLEFKGKYDLKVRIVLVDLAGKGDIYGVMGMFLVTFLKLTLIVFIPTEDYKARVKLRGKKYQKNGQTFIHFDKIQMKIQIGRSKIELKNLFDNNPTLGLIGNGFINENSETFVSEIIPSLEKNLSEIFTRAANEIVKDASLDEMFPNY
jgi:hypothetical protein